MLSRRRGGGTRALIVASLLAAPALAHAEEEEDVPAAEAPQRAIPGTAVAAGLRALTQQPETADVLTGAMTDATPEVRKVASAFQTACHFCSKAGKS